MQGTTSDLRELLHGQKVVAPPSSEDFVTATLIVDCHCELGEGVIYDEKRNTVLWTDILKSKLHTLRLQDPSKVVFSTFALPKRLGSFGLLEYSSDNDDCSSLPLLCAFEDSFQLYDVMQQKALSEMSRGEDVNPAKGTSRLNDGRVDPAGKHFIAGGYYGDMAGIKMKVYQCEQKDDKSLMHEPIVDNVEVTNSISWSLDGSTMYLADSPTKQIHSYAYNSATGTLTDKKLVHEKDLDEESVPDGSCVDAEGYIWNAVWRSGTAPGMIQRIDPSTGKVVFTVHMPDSTSQVTCCCFGGKGLDILFITSAAESQSRTKEPHAGGLYAVRLPFKGRPESRLKFKLSSIANKICTPLVDIFVRVKVMFNRVRRTAKWLLGGIPTCHDTPKKRSADLKTSMNALSQFSKSLLYKNKILVCSICHDAFSYSGSQQS